MKRMPRLTPEVCQEMVRAYAAGESLHDIGRRIGITRTAVAYRIRKAGGAMRNHSEAGKQWAERSNYRGPGLAGERHGGWKGGHTLCKGYVVVMAKNHPRVPPHGYMPLHVLIAEAKIGRHLLPGEVAHHVNGDKYDNRPENLEVMTRSDHCRHHLPRLGTGCKSA